MAFDRKIRVFVSSTSADLREFRKTVADMIGRLAGYECVHQEHFTASAQPPDALSRSRVADCDLFVGILGHTYGSIPPAEERSYTEREYDAAVAAKKPRLMFVCPEAFPIPSDIVEDDDRRAKQRTFREKVQAAETTPHAWATPQALAVEVLLGIVQWERERFRTQPKPPKRAPRRSSGLGTAYSIANPYQQAAAQLTAEVTMVRSGVSRLRYVAGPPGFLKTQLLEDVAGRVDGQLLSVAIDAAQDDDLAKFYSAVGDSVAAFGIDCRRSDAASIRKALRDAGKKLLLLVDSYHSYFINADRNDRAAVDRWFTGIKELEKDGNAFVLMAGSVNPTHWYVSQFFAGGGSARIHVSPQPLGESFEDAWSGRIAKDWSLDGTRLQRIWQRAEGHPRSFLEGASALASGRDPEGTVEAWQQWAGNAALDVVPSCCRHAMRLAASGGDVAQRANCRDALLDARFLRKNEQNVIVPALSMWNTIWRNLPI